MANYTNLKNVMEPAVVAQRPPCTQAEVDSTRQNADYS
jgi:hypothetical protein